MNSEPAQLPSPNRSERSRELQGFAASALFLLCAWAAFLWPVLAQGRAPVYRDILHTTLPMGEYLGARLRAGQLPQWFPFEGLGEPFIGQLNESTFHPASWLYAFLPGVTALRWELLLAYLAAAAGQFLLARRLGLGALAAVLAGIVFAFSGYAVSLSNLIPYLWGLASLPWLGLCAAEVFTREKPWPWVAALALVWATAVLAGDSHSALFGGLVVLFVGAVLGKLRRLPLCVLASLLAIGLAGVELLPAIDLVRAGPRAGWSHIPRALSSYWALHPYRLPELIFPGWMPPESGSFFGLDRYKEARLWALTIYVGLPVVALALVALWRRTRRGVLSALLAIFGLWLALGVHGGLELGLRHLFPFLNVLRYPEKHLALFTFGISLAAACGLEEVRARPGRKLPLALAGLAAGCVLAALLLPHGLPTTIWPRLRSMPVRSGLIATAWRASLFTEATSLLLCAVILSAATRSRALLLLLPLAIFVELWSANATAIEVGPAFELAQTPHFCSTAIEAGAGPAGLRAVNAASSHPGYHGPENAIAWMALSRNMLEPDASALCGIGSLASGPTLSNESRLFREVVGSEHLDKNPALPLFGFGLVVIARGDKIAGGTIIDAIVHGDDAFALVQRPAAPRAFAAVPRWVRSEAEGRRELARGLALVSSPVLTDEAATGVAPAQHSTAEGAPPEGDGPAGTVRIAEYAPERVVLDAQMSRAGAVVLNDLFAPGWSATLDAAPARIYPANVLARGVLVPAGAHRIEMRYALPRLRTGIFISLASLLCCAALLFFGRRRAPQSRIESPESQANPDQDAHELQREYWSKSDRAHLAWQTENRYVAATESALLDSVSIQTGESFLELGCGEGANLRNLGARLAGARVFALDFSPPKALIAAEAGAHGTCADAARLPFRDCAFDAILIRDLLHHVPDRAAVLAEAARVLKPGGRLTLIEPNGKNPLIAAMALGIRAERGMLASSPLRVETEVRAAGFTRLRIEPRQPLPLSRVLLHYQYGAPSLAKFAAARALLRLIERACAVLPRSRWSYFVLDARRD